jgi:hypothetical protein
MTWLNNTLFLPVIILFITGSSLALMRPQPKSMLILAVQYIAVSWLASTSLPAAGVAAKLVTGLLVCVIFYLGIRQIGEDPLRGDDQLLSANLPFSIIALLLVTVASVSVARSNLFAQFDIGIEASVGALFLIAASLLNLGLGTDQLRIGIGLLTFVSGAELIYGFIEPALALIALLAMVHLGIVLVFSYIISIQIRYAMTENSDP